jgi:hypothetical protein
MEARLTNGRHNRTDVHALRVGKAADATFSLSLPVGETRRVTGTRDKHGQCRPANDDRRCDDHGFASIGLLMGRIVGLPQPEFVIFLVFRD